MAAGDAPRRALLGLLLVLVAACGGGWSGSIGVRARRAPETGTIVVTDVPKGLAGERAGLSAGDEIVAVDGVPTVSMSNAAFSRAVRGEVGSRVTLTVRRAGVVEDVIVERGPLLAP